MPKFSTAIGNHSFLLVMVLQLSINRHLWVNCYLPLLYLFGCIYFICWCCQEFSNTDSGYPPSAFRCVCLCMVCCFASLIIKCCIKHLISLFEIWTGIARSIVAHHYNINLHRVHIPTLPFLLDARKVIRLEQNIPNTSAIYNGSSPCSRSKALTSLWPFRHATIRGVYPLLSLA